MARTFTQVHLPVQMVIRPQDLEKVIKDLMVLGQPLMVRFVIHFILKMYTGNFTISYLLLTRFHKSRLW